MLIVCDSRLFKAERKTTKKRDAFKVSEPKLTLTVTLPFTVRVGDLGHTVIFEVATVSIQRMTHPGGREGLHIMIWCSMIVAT